MNATGFTHGQRLSRSNPIGVFGVGATSLAVILWSAVLPAVGRIETDFSNYYIPARLIARGEPTSRLYEFSWFQRQMEYAGVRDALGGFNYFPPPAALPLVPLGKFDPLTAKALWSMANLGMLLALLFVLRRLRGLGVAAGLLLAALSGSALHDNFVFGQFYIALTLLIAVSLMLMLAGRSGAAGALLGFGTALKLYPAPFFAYFLVRRDWRAAGTFVAALAGTFALSIWALGWPLHQHYLASILPASLAGQTDNPFDPELQSWTNVLRLLLVREPTLNPNPLVDLPLAFHFCRDAALLSLLSLVAFTLRKRNDIAETSLLVLVLLLLSTSVFSYHALLAIIPVALWSPRLWRERRFRTFIAVIGLYLFAVSPLSAHSPILHLRLCALTALLFLLLRDARPWRVPRAVWAGIVVLSSVHAAWAVRRHRTDSAEPIAWNAPHIESPSASPVGLVYSELGCAGCAKYELRGDVPRGIPTAAHQLAPAFARNGNSLFVEIAHDGRSRVAQVHGDSVTWWTPETWRCEQPAPSADGGRLAAVCNGGLYLFDAPMHGRALRVASGEIADPDLAPAGGRLAFARLPGREAHWQVDELDIVTGRVRLLTDGWGDERGPRYSPDGMRLVFSRRARGWDAVWLRDLTTRVERQLTRSTGNDDQPAWSADGRTVYFASDRGRGIFMPAVYRLAFPVGATPDTDHER